MCPPWLDLSLQKQLEVEDCSAISQPTVSVASLIVHVDYVGLPVPSQHSTGSLAEKDPQTKYSNPAVLNLLHLRRQ